MRISEPALKHLIKSKGMTIESFGAQLGMKRQGVYNLMIRKYVKEPMVLKICKVLSVDRKEFLMQEDVTSNPSTLKELLAEKDKIVAEKDKIISQMQNTIDAQDRIIKWMEHFMNKPRKSFARAMKTEN